tara:strand:- start:156 stop:620 length:465 start_codon:yes stop_codon:yes gene_type:complete
MIKKIFVIILFLFTTSCGYEAMHTKKNRDNFSFSIKKLYFEGDKIVNLKIKRKLDAYKDQVHDKNLLIRINTSSTKIILAKDVAANTTTFSNKITVTVEVSGRNITQKNLIFIETFNYDNTSNKFQLKSYEREIKNNLAETIAEKLIFGLSNIQ